MKVHFRLLVWIKFLYTGWSNFSRITLNHSKEDDYCVGKGLPTPINNWLALSELTLGKPLKILKTLKGSIRHRILHFRVFNAWNSSFYLFQKSFAMAVTLTGSSSTIVDFLAKSVSVFKGKHQEKFKIKERIYPNQNWI